MKTRKGILEVFENIFVKERNKKDVINIKVN
jgi:hypothetical protein